MRQPLCLPSFLLAPFVQLFGAVSPLSPPSLRLPLHLPDVLSITWQILIYSAGQFCSDKIRVANGDEALVRTLSPPVVFYHFCFVRRSFASLSRGISERIVHSRPSSQHVSSWPSPSPSSVKATGRNGHKRWSVSERTLLGAWGKRPPYREKARSKRPKTSSGNSIAQTCPASFRRNGRCQMTSALQTARTWDGPKLRVIHFLRAT